MRGWLPAARRPRLSQPAGDVDSRRVHFPLQSLPVVAPVARLRDVRVDCVALDRTHRVRVRLHRRAWRHDNNNNNDRRNGSL